MRFGPLPIDEAQGAILAHSEMTSAGLLRKGQWVGPEAIRALRADGRTEVTVARPDPDDLHEDEAAERLARALVPEEAESGFRVTKAATGRVNIHARAAGLVRINRTAIDALNAVNPMITLATVVPFYRADAGAMVGTVKIISYAVPGADVAGACGLAQGALGLLRPVVRTATLIETMSDGQEPAPKGRAATAKRLARLAVDLAPRVVVAHEVTALTRAIREARTDIILILTATATSDADDVAPMALRQAGGRVIQYGIPVDPGNLLFLGKAGSVPVIGLPGCARSPALNGADWVLERVVCGIDLGPADLAAMGVGGLLKEMPSRPRLRQG
jgi:molybdenum cofactor cytidylyltransferase